MKRADAETRATGVAYARGLMGGMLVGIPVLMTMEVWWQGFYMSAPRLILLYIVNYGVLFILQHYSGLHHKKTLPAQARAALVAYGIGIVASTIVLIGLGVLRDDMQIREIAGKLLLQSVPVSIGSSVAMTEFGAGTEVTEARKEQVGYWGSLAMALAGATFLGFGISATEEPLMVAMQLTWKQAMLLVIVSIAQVHVIVYVADFRTRHRVAQGWRRGWKRLLSDALSTYALALIVAGYLLWTFGDIGTDTGLLPATYMLVTLGFVTSFGAAAGELLI